jgi:hypothetical protein
MLPRLMHNAFARLASGLGVTTDDHRFALGMAALLERAFQKLFLQRQSAYLGMKGFQIYRWRGGI